MLFRSSDLSTIKEYLQGELDLVLRDRVPLTDLIISREVKLERGEQKQPTPATIVSMRKMHADRRSTPQYAERVPYLVVYRDRFTKLADLVMSPEDQNARPNAEYYITKQILPPLERIFSLFGVDVRTWYDEMPRVAVDGSATRLQLHRHPAIDATDEAMRAKEGEGYMVASRQCLAKYSDMRQACLSCAGMPPAFGKVECESNVCPMYYARVRAHHAAQAILDSW
ncbi:hypothetical protein THASP1DRAFT_32868 [Thamnocephalis sphaerospora]|uniref:DNA-directed DNA polymerase n=1 Tax=Thamnocephalis sphaerospora TaxID=78915 RepID=A0A4P9XHW5_9FUNG|nr:hypothetical protein THASP1DRAFT_32868 [Thamnocephalis sphaerospora]|eukprot:RKP05293.1 hypothetical protein THASP1DRAFT_32868 [Thamnocephalis sphaerospora]